MAQNWKRQASVAYGCALTRLALNLYLYVEQCGGWESEGRLEALRKRYMELLGLFLNGEQDRVTEEIPDFRRQISEEMGTLIACSDAFQVYEYALNRVERRFVKGSAVEVDDEAFVGNLMRYLASGSDAAIQNQRIQMIVGQLPVRFTRQKYFGMIHDALTSYIGSDPAGLKDMMYLLRSAGMVGLLTERRENYKELSQALSGLERLSFKDLTVKEYEDARKEVSEAGGLLTELSQSCVSLQELTNDLYILCLTGKDAVKNAQEEEHARGILEGLWRLYKQEKAQIPQKISENLPLLEGIQEEYYEKYQRLDFHWDESADGKENLRVSQLVDRLMSTSAFADLEELPEAKTITSEDVEAAADGFFTEMQSVFSSCQKPVVRAIMALTLSCLPVFFNSSEEIRSYIKNSLDCCSDRAEKEASMELLLKLMESDGYDLV